VRLQIRDYVAARRRIYLLRHGEVSYFDADGRPLPPLDVPLNASGVRQAEAARDALRGVALDRVVTSGLPRTMETAEIITRGRGLGIESLGDLREIAPGRLLDMAGENFEQRFVGALDGDIGRETRFLAGETCGSLQDRVLPVLRGLIESPSWKEMMIVAHGGTNRVILLHALGADLSSLGRIEQDAGSINVIDVSGDGKFLVRMMNYTPYSHLKDGLWTTTMEKILLEHLEALGAGRRGSE